MIVMLELVGVAWITLYDTDSKECFACPYSDYILLVEYNFFSESFRLTRGLRSDIYYAVGDSYLNVSEYAYGHIDEVKYSNFPFLHNTDDTMLDILCLIRSSHSQQQLHRKVASIAKNISKHIGIMPTDEQYEKLNLKIPKNRVLTRQELKEYEGYLGCYLLTNNIRTRLTYAVPDEYTGDYLNRVFVEGEYRVEGDSVIFSDGVTTCLAELLNTMDTSSEFPIDAYRTACALADNQSRSGFATILRLKVGESLSYPAYHKYTVLHDNNFIRVEPLVYSDNCFYSLHNISHKDAFGLYPYPLRFVTLSADAYNKINKVNISGLNGLTIDFTRCGFGKVPSIVGDYTYIGVDYIAVTEKGYDIRVLMFQQTERDSKTSKKTIYSIPLLCSGLRAKKYGEGYCIRFALQQLTLSKHVYENLVCVGNGEKVITVNDKKGLVVYNKGK